jgi:hypothetical protein
MKLTRKLLFCAAVGLAGLVSISIAQSPPPPAAPKGSARKEIVVQDSLTKLKVGEAFSSSAGRFTVALPRSISGFAAQTPQAMGANLSGGSFKWSLREGAVAIIYLDHLDPNFFLATDQSYDEYFARLKNNMERNLNATVVSATPTRIKGASGYKYELKSANGSKLFARVYYANKRTYTLIVQVASQIEGAEALLTKALDSFAVIPQEKIDSDLKKILEASTPAALPQEPVAKKERSDAEDENIKGKVKKVTEEDEDLSGTWSLQGRNLSSIEEYNEKGNRVERIPYDDTTGHPFEVTVYGYIDGARVSKYQNIENESDPPPLTVITTPRYGASKPSDNRYSYRYEYKYAGGRLVEMQMFHNNGRTGMRYTYSYANDQMEELVYDEEGKLNQKYVYKLDEKGNFVERSDVDVFPSKSRGDRKYKISYESFDDQGNWTKKITSKLVEEGGSNIYKPWYISYRELEYYK